MVLVFCQLISSINKELMKEVSAESSCFLPFLHSIRYLFIFISVPSQLVSDSADRALTNYPSAKIEI